MKKIVLFLIFTEFFNLIVAQKISSFRDSILKENLQKDVAFLCDPDLSGREFASPGEMKSAAYIRDQFVSYHLTGINKDVDDYFQKYIYSYDTLISFNIENQNVILKYISDFFSFEFWFLHDTSDVEFIYAGFGLDRDDYSDYENIDVKNKWVVVEINSPIDSTGKLMDFFDSNLPVNLYEISKKKETAMNHGAIGIVFKVNSEKYVPEVLSHIMESRHTYRSKDDITLNLDYGIFPGIVARTGIIDSIMGIKSCDLNSLINSKLKNHQSAAGLLKTKVSFKIEKQKRDFRSQNVVGVIKGIEDKVGIIVSAHYDAVKGNDSLSYPGANDNASGTAATLQLANVFSEITKSGNKPENTIAFVLFSGEEVGLVGSRYFVKHIPFLMDSSTLVINLDCVGIVDTSKFDQGGLCIASPENVINRYAKMLNDIALKEEQPFRIDFNQYFQYSDNLSFTNCGYQALHISTGGGEVMHSPQDRPELFNYNNFVNVTQLVFDFIILNTNFLNR